MTNISWVIDLIENLPEFLAYVVPGYLFIFTYRYILYKDKDSANHTAYILINSVVVSFVLKTIYDSILLACKAQLAEHKSLYLIVLFIMSAVLGYALSKFVPSKIMRKMRFVLGINRTSHENIWDDIMVPGVWLRIWPRGFKNSYLGQIKFIENFNPEPIVVLEYYRYLDEDGGVLIDNYEKPERTVMLNLKDFKRVEIISEKAT